MTKPLHSQVGLRSRLLSPLLVLLGLQFAGGCSKPPPAPVAPVAPAVPRVLAHQFQGAFLGDNQMTVRLRNDGEAGHVMIIVRGRRYTKHTERGESGLEKSLRETFTTKHEPSPKEIKTFQIGTEWGDIIHMASGETTDVVIKLPGHSSLERVAFDVRAVGIPRGPTAK